MMPEAEILKITSEILTALDIGDFKIRINHRKLLEAAVHIIGGGTE